MKQIETIAGIDIGTKAVRIAVGQLMENRQAQIMGVGEAPSRGVTKGAIVDLDETVTSVSEAIEKAERMIGAQLSRVVIGVSGPHTKVVQSQGVIAVGKPNGEVQQSDIDRAIEQSQAVAAAPNYEILHVLPRSYNLDNQTNLRDPLGMTGIKLEAFTQIILAQGAQVKHLTKCAYRTQLDMEGLVFSPLACAHAVLSKRQKDLGVVLVNIGAGTTSVAVFEEGELVHAAVVPVGADNITADLAILLRVSMELAEQVKLDQEHVDASKVSKREEIDLAKYSTEEMPRTMASRKMIASIIEARLKELFSLVDHELKTVGRSGKLPAGVVLTGGGSKQRGLIDFAKDAMRLPVFMGEAQQIFTPIDKVKEPEFSTALGIVLYAIDQEEVSVQSSPARFLARFAGSLTRRIRDLLP